MRVGGKRFSRRECFFATGFLLGLTTSSLLSIIKHLWTVNRIAMSSHNKTTMKHEMQVWNVRLACLVLTQDTNHVTRAQTVKSTWGQRCHRLIFFSDKPNDFLPAVPVNVTSGRDHLWGKVKSIFVYAHDHLINDFDWFLKADDDTYVIIENLHHLLISFDHRAPHFLGTWFNREKTKGYMSGGAGYVLSSSALSLFVSQHSTMCTPGEKGDEDIEMGKCMASLNVTFADTRDQLGRSKFFQIEPFFHLRPEPIGRKHWFYNLPHFPIPRDKGCCSDRAIAFHRISPDWMRVLEYFIYRFKTK